MGVRLQSVSHQRETFLSASAKRIGGESLLDLTCGLGMDAAALAGRFRRVVALERDQVLASVTSGNPVYAYAGWLMGYIHLGNALYRVDPDTYWAIRDSLPETVKTDLAYNNAYWNQFRDTVAQAVSKKVYES